MIITIIAPGITVVVELQIHPNEGKESGQEIDILVCVLVRVILNEHLAARGHSSLGLGTLTRTDCGPPHFVRRSL